MPCLANLFPPAVSSSVKTSSAVAGGKGRKRKRPRAVEESCEGVELVEGGEEEIAVLLKQLIKVLIV